MHDEAAFLEAIQSDPNDDTARLVYADWLEERGDPKGEYLRVEVELASCPPASGRADLLRRRMHALMLSVNDRGWIAMTCRSRVSVCERCITSKFRCRNRWSDLEPSDQATVRRCSDCRDVVFFCESMTEALFHVHSARCVVLDASKDPEFDRDLRDVVPIRYDRLENLQLIGFVSIAIDMTHPAPPTSDQIQRFRLRQATADAWLRTESFELPQRLISSSSITQ